MGTASLQRRISYFGHWVEKNFDEFVIYVAFVAPDNNVTMGSTTWTPGYPAPHTSDHYSR